ncbi:hypothetical protein HNQ56_004342 [Anaerotaenia torta]
MMIKGTNKSNIVFKVLSHFWISTSITILFFLLVILFEDQLMIVENMLLLLNIICEVITYYIYNFKKEYRKSLISYDCYFV